MESSSKVRASSLDILKKNVIEPGLCVACGACVGLCPHIIFYDGQIAAPDACDLVDGRCAQLCPVNGDRDPQTRRDDLLTRAGLEPGGEIGPVIQAWQARGTDGALKGKAQYGGVVSSLTALALEQGLAQAAMLTTPGPTGAPQGVLASSLGEVLSSAGSIYAAGGGLAALNEALSIDGGPRLMAVGLPCQALAAASMKQHPKYSQAAQRLGLVIGLFCTWNLNARKLRELLKEEGAQGRIGRMDIPPPPAEVFEVATEQGDLRIPLERVRTHTMPGCSLCPDMTAETADISVGAVEGRPGWNTVLLRTPAGAELFDLARDKGILEVEPAEESSLEHLIGAAQAKRDRALAAWKEKHNA